MTTAAIKTGDQVRHPKHGVGSVVAPLGVTTVVRFLHGIEECETDVLERTATPDEAAGRDRWDAPIHVIALAQAAAIRSVNDAWGVFSRSRVDLLPHQLWVCRKVNAEWPTRWLVADDVGLGKTIEAGLVLLPLLSRQVVRRLLILCPASLVSQWQQRLREMFGLRMAQYVAEADTPKSDFWNTHTHVIASLQTMRLDRGGRHARFFDSPPWDLVLVDEAHHLNADEDGGPTLGYKFVQRMVDERRVHSMVFFSGTPHRGKNFGFLSLVRLLRPDLFDPKRPLRAQLPQLRKVMIRNNKQNVTDLRGERLFQAPQVAQETYRYSPEEAEFYALLTDFIATGKAYASSLSAGDARMVSLVLIAMQKLASSSVAAISRAIRGRLERLRQQSGKVKALATRAQDLRATLNTYAESATDEDFDRLSRAEEDLVSAAEGLSLMANEEPRLVELLAAADRVQKETKIEELIRIVDTRFSQRSVLFFTEYKATQSLLMSALIRRFGEDCVAFINGDNCAEKVLDTSGRKRTLYTNREEAAEKFNSGDVRFLVSTEAGGEGIDLQKRCHTLVHVDLPWNPMRLHQRVGRVNRYGQKERVDVLSLRNPDTVEARIWDKLNQKIASINEALAHVMDEPEDLLQLVLGMVSPELFTELFSEATEVPDDRLSKWFDAKTASFGGQDAIEAVRDLVGQCARFDFQQMSKLLPPLDLPALQPFFELALAANGRRVRRTQDSISFKTPKAWKEPGLRQSYEGVTFDRRVAGRNAIDRVFGVGHRLIDRALAEALDTPARTATVSVPALTAPLIVVRIRDRVTGGDRPTAFIVAGIQLTEADPSNVQILTDWQTLELLNTLSTAPGVRAKSSRAPEARADVQRAIAAALDRSQPRLAELGAAFQVPMVETIAVLWPSPRAAASVDVDEILAVDEDEDSA